ncbi:polymorphic toxin-type HINT domain-containing protein [Nonomuraea jiangxiensis]|uniref:RHS repeat-associated core domain-containing protein n=1 Tax=Nonomuraea jiangxiensis TaxID=633440 RepID=A0A1G8QE06_9ACTN|nr:polymorphic toxin-type HINT domain-containing protein [Nonomuraea jiangxiensis]SDJ02803.1 RHS repeat-associated core domain-containing protein [Nonomuraea jiangxiensis]
MGSRRMRRVAFIALGSLLTTHLIVLPTTARADQWNPPEPQKDTLVKGAPVPVESRKPDPAEARALKEPPAVAWPKPGNGTVELGAAGAARAASLVAVPGLPVRVGPATNAGESSTARTPGPQRVRVELLGREGSRAEVRLRVTRADDATQVAPVRLEFDYSAFRHAYGGDWAARLRLVELPGCAPAATCPVPRPLPTRNDVTRGTLTADVKASATGAGGLYAITGAPSGGTGSFTASSLSPTAKWQVSAQTGDFSWSYPLRTPPSLGGPTPQLALTYSAGSVDGRTASTNNQPSWAGEGFDFTPGGFIERRYKSCNDDDVTPKTGEQCWAGENATMMLGGSATELVRDTATGKWRPKHDDGSRVEKLTGAANGDNDGEHWKVTTPEGTQYFFGLNRLPGWSSGKQESRSAWTVPVFGDDSGEPCHGSDFAGSWCQQAYRWNLDHVVDSHGNTLSYFYTQEVNHYGRNITAADETPYVAGGYLQRVEYGQRAGQVYTTPATARALFTVAERCLVTASFDCAPDKLTEANAKHWPDVPADQICAAGKDCPNFAPTFFTRKRLAKVTTQVLSGTSYTDVDSWTLTHTFPATGDGMSAALWLEKLQHTGHVGGTASTPAIDFDGVEMPNRVDGLEGIAPMTKWRIGAVNNETGGRLMVNYSQPECTRSSLPQAHANGRRCFPTYWAPEGATDPYLDWFHKYVAVQVLEDDVTGGSPIVRTDYSYLGAAAWAFDDQELVPDKRRTWSQWRGYEKVQVIKGGDGDQRTATEHLFFRGMHGDRQPDNGRRNVQVTDSEGVKADDHWRLQGFERETRYLNGPGGAEDSGTINDPWLHGPTADGGGDQAYKLDTAKVRSRTRLSTGVLRRTETQRSFDAEGAVTQLNDLGDVTTPDDDECTRYTYARNTTAWIMSLPSRTETVAVACTATPSRPADVIGDGRMSYDGGAHGAAPTKGDLTKVEELDSYSGDQPQYVTVARSTFDDYGRVKETYDAAGNLSRTEYTPATGGPVTKVAAANALGHTETTWLRPEWGTMAAQEDANGRRTDLAYEPMGRLAKVWLPGRDPSKPPNGEFTYQVRTDQPVAVTTRTLRNDGTYTVGHELYDGLLRLRQTQLPAHGGGRLLSDTIYNTLGQVAKKNDVYTNADPPSTALLGVADGDVPAQFVYGYDALGRTTSESLKVMGTEKWRTTTTHAPDRIDVDPPTGDTPTTTILDSRGRAVELRQYKGEAPTGDYDATRYTYAKNGQQETTTDPAGNVWRSHFDLRNRVTKAEDPDKGASTYTYDVLGQMTTSTDARGRTLAYVYDKLGRRTATHEDSASGPKLAGWTYDTLADGTQVKGMPVASTRYAGGHAYTTRVDSYDDQYRPTSLSYVIPGAEGALAGTYAFRFRYNADGTVDSMTLPAAGRLESETVRTLYTELGLPRETRSNLATYVGNTLYTKQGEPLQERWGAEGSVVLHDYTYEEGTRRVARRITDRQTGSQVRHADVRYSYDQAGNILKIADTPPVENAPSDVQCFAYDYLRRLTEAWTATNDCATAANASVVGGAAPYWHSYTYDKTGGRLTETRHAVGGATRDTTSTYAYPGPGRARPHALQQVTTEGPAGTRLDTYSYDNAGNTTVRKLGEVEQRMEWDAEGQLAKVTEDGKVTSFLYDADGNRLIRRDPAGTTLYLGTTELKLATGGTAAQATRYYAHGSETVAVRTDDQRLTWLVPDHNGTAEMSVDAESLQVTRRRFDPFGNPRGPQPASWPSQQAFIGGTADASTGLTHLGAREYDPAAGRFLSVDPVMDPSDPQNLHGYAYSQNNPVTFSDPTGLREVCGNYSGECADAPPDGTRPGGGSPGGGGSPPPPKGGPSQKDQDDAKRTTKKSWMDVAIEVGGKAILDIIGYTDVKDCLGGSIGACASAVIGIVPWGKIAKTLKAAYRAAKAVLAWYERVKWARRVLREADEAAAAAAKYQDDLAKWKKAQEAASATKKAEAGPAGGKNLVDVAGGGASCNSFVPGTTVLMADGTRRPIEEVRLGDEVLATDPETGETSARPVVATILGEGHKHLVEVTVDTDGPRGDDTGLVIATDNHPFWVDDEGRWTDAADLEAGDTVLTPEGDRLTVVSLREREADLRVHNLTIDGVHTYYVTTGDADVLVHNKNRGGCGPTHRDNQRLAKQSFNHAKEARKSEARSHNPVAPRVLKIAEVKPKPTREERALAAAKYQEIASDRLGTPISELATLVGWRYAPIVGPVIRVAGAGFGWIRGKNPPD